MRGKQEMSGQWNQEEIFKKILIFLFTVSHFDQPQC